MSLATIIILLALFSCNNNTDETVEEQKADSVIQTDFCYTGIINRDTVLLNVNITDTLVTGGLIYNFLVQRNWTGIRRNRYKKGRCRQS